VFLVPRTPRIGPFARIPSVLALLLLLAGAGVAGGSTPRGTSDAGLRGLWVVRTSLTSPQAIARLVTQARSAGVTALFVQVRGRGDAYYANGIEPRAASLRDAPPGFDPLASVLAAARPAGLEVHAWINVNLAAPASGRLPAGNVLARHPEWAMVPRALMAPAPRGRARARRPDLARLVSWTRSESATVEGLFTSVIHPDAANHTVAVITDIARRYAVDGIHLDYLRYPRDDFDYGPEALRAFRESVLADIAPTERARLDARLAAEPLLYTDAFPQRWAAFRRSRLTALVMRVRTAVREVRPGAALSAAVYPDSEEAATRKLQDWATWAQQGLLDALCPMAYTTDDRVFATQVAEAVRIGLPARIWAGIGTYKVPARQAAEQTRAARAAGAHGFVLFSYDSMMATPGGVAGYFVELNRAAARDGAPSRR
jgi:uncharacterized lipoprotein YddW (UPF0748 family)